MCRRSQILRFRLPHTSSSSKKIRTIWASTRKSKFTQTSSLKQSTNSFCLFLLSRSIKVKCPYCDAVSNSIVEYQPSLVGYVLTMIAMLLFGFLSLVLMPFLISLTKTAIHRCAKCLN